MKMLSITPDGSTDSLDQLTDLVVENFSLIPNRNKDPLPAYYDEVFGEEQKGVSQSRRCIPQPELIAVDSRP